MSWKVRLEFVLAADGDGGPDDAVDVIFASQTLTGTGATVVTSDAAPAFRNKTHGLAKVTVLSGAVLVAIDDVTPTETDSVRVAAGDAPRPFGIDTGKCLSFAEAADGAASGALPTGAATAANQTSANTKLDTIHADLTGVLAVKSPAPGSPVTATIASGASLSGAVDMDTERVHRIATPAAWTAAAITFQSSSDGSVWNDLYTELGEYTLSSAVVGASRAIVLDQAVFYGIRHLKIRSGTSAAPVNQVASRAITVVSVPR